MFGGCWHDFATAGGVDDLTRTREEKVEVKYGKTVKE